MSVTPSAAGSSPLDPTGPDGPGSHGATPADTSPPVTTELPVTVLDGAAPGPAPTVLPSPLLGLPGAVAGTGRDTGLAWHYGDPMGEQRVTTLRTGLFDTSTRGRLTVTGPDRLTWLHTLTSQFLSTAADGTVTQALVLSPQGHVEHHMNVTVLPDAVHLDTEPGAHEGLLAYLTGMVFWSKVEIADRTADLGGLLLVGPTTAEVLGQVLGAGTQLPGGADTAVVLPAGGPQGWLRRTTAGTELVVARGDLAALAAQLVRAGARPAGTWAADALRVLDRRPRWGVDTDERTIPNEVEWLRTAVHLNKGCYRGQETVARVDNIGRPPRRLVLLNLDGSMERLPETGDAVVSGAGRVVGRLGTVVHHHEDGPVALALLKRAIEPGVPLLAGGVDAVMDPADAPEPETAPRSAVDHRALRSVRRP
ncbi:folate-binding protein YgfZ [Nakamurella flavida]|uniref:Folate-binding protein YgfZ n=1 Tax=Nakamurella flavida TaxID=363630 RepID=A0A938YR16_9ACTN|nr:folate-binding protein YgfZ [Nakamurella flavida]MBM9477653.1 folate-binding protein YgfZ [Nakamurella flavida]MDP9779203.1 folate-binding protein YgfZ [Nakamurella flavida]